ncbi:MAG TPA: Gfo/Idh/MocA family oxidoreductase [Puia sp.]
MKEKLRFAILGCGFWARYQLPAWLELEGVEPVALYNRTLSKAESLGKQYNIPNCYDNVEELLEKEELDFVDIITDVDTHAPLVRLAAEKGLPVICQKPMAPSLSLAQDMLDGCSSRNVPFFIHENFRFQTPIRRLKALLDEGVIGRPFKASVKFCTAFPVFRNQPFLAELDHFILTDIGSHLFDVCRFLFGEASSLYCQSAGINPGIRGEDVANALLTMAGGLHCYVEMSFASIVERDSFPQTFILIEGEKGSLHLTADYEIRMTTRNGTKAVTAPPVSYPWMDPVYAVVHSSIVDCNRNILQALQGLGPAETTGKDNFETVKLVWAAYQSIKSKAAVNLTKFNAILDQPCH